MSMDKTEETKTEVKAADQLKFMSPHEREAFFKSRRNSKALIRAILYGPQSGRRVNAIAKAQGKRDKYTGARAGVSNVDR